MFLTVGLLRTEPKTLEKSVMSLNVKQSNQLSLANSRVTNPGSDHLMN